LKTARDGHHAILKETKVNTDNELIEETARELAEERAREAAEEEAREVAEEEAREVGKTEPETTPIEKPDVPLSATAALNKFKAKRAPGMPNTVTKPDALDIRRIGEMKDYVRLSPFEHHWSEEYCFVTVPVDGQRDGVLHLILPELAEQLPPKLIQHYRVALASGATKGSFFLCIVPTQNLTNGYNKTAVDACIEAKTSWLIVTAQKEKGRERYEITRAGSSHFAPEPEWDQWSTIDEIVLARFDGQLQIDNPNHPGFRRLRGLPQVM
jgi:hypothetical protein